MTNHGASQPNRGVYSTGSERETLLITSSPPRPLQSAAVPVVYFFSSPCRLHCPSTSISTAGAYASHRLKYLHQREPRINMSTQTGKVSRRSSALSCFESSLRFDLSFTEGVLLYHLLGRSCWVSGGLSRNLPPTPP
jgi:hypothetical protein